MDVSTWLASNAHLGLAVLLLACLLSFSWAMKNFFTKPSGRSPGMMVIKWCGTLFGIAHLITLIVGGTVVPAQVLGAAILYAASLSLFWWALHANRNMRLSAVFSSDQPQHLVMQGPYRVIRHPFYSSYLLMWLAGFLATGQAYMFATTAIMAGIYHVAAVSEERKFARSDLAAAYKNYTARTGRFIPNPLKWIRAGWRTQETA